MVHPKVRGMKRFVHGLLLIVRNVARVPINMLPDEALLEIFNFYVNDEEARLDVWHTLVHVCRRWRYVVLRSPNRLDLRLVYTGRRSTTEVLDVWPCLPIAIRQWVSYNNDPQTSSGVRNIVAALNSWHHDRVREIGIGNISSPLWERFATVMQKPFPELTHLEILLNDAGAPIVPGSFLGGSAPRLRALLLDNVPFPAMQKLLLSANDLVHLRLWDIPRTGYISPEVIVACLSSTTRLEVFSLKFHSPRSRPNPRRLHAPPLTRGVIPALILLEFRGAHDYLENLLARIDAPLLHDLRIGFFMALVFNIPQLHRFISRTETFKIFDRATVSFFHDAVQFNLSPPMGIPGPATLELKVYCRQSDWQLSSLARVCSSSLPLFSTLEKLEIMDNHRPPEWKEDMESTQWLELLDAFTSVKNLYLSKERIALCVMHALQELAGVRVSESLPTLQNLFLWGLRPSGPVQETIKRFVAARQHSGYPLTVHRWERE